LRIYFFEFEKFLLAIGLGLLESLTEGIDDLTRAAIMLTLVAGSLLVFHSNFELG
jgi:hypothetical protein